VHRRRRILLNSATVTSLVLCVAAIVLWIYSHEVTRPPWWSRDVGTNGWESVVIWPGSVMFERGTRLITSASQLPGVVSNPVTWQRGALGITVEGRESRAGDPSLANPPVYTRSTAVFVRLWMPTLLTSILPVIWLFRNPWIPLDLIDDYLLGGRAERARKGRCAKCGYDLRATPDRCPECGTVPAATTVATERSPADRSR
jgi:hypothetical protein